jgi:hypothetical protein
MAESDSMAGMGEEARAFWERAPSIYEHIAGHVRTGEPWLMEGGQELPDAGRVAFGAPGVWVAGAKDGVVVQHMGAPDDQTRDAVANELLDLVDAYCRAPIQANKQRVHAYVADKQVIGFIDPFVMGLVKHRKPDPARVHELARALAIKSPDREPVKLGIALLGIFQGLAQQSVFKMLGRHDEFTLFCVVALKSVVDSPEEEIWDVARNVKGWGRVAAVQQLHGTEHAQIKQWMLREGFRNTVMNEYLAYTCAVHGGLLEALSRDRVDDELLDATGEILIALLNPKSPAQGIHEYDDGAEVVELYVKHMSLRGATDARRKAMDAVKKWLSRVDQDWDTKEQVARRMRSLSACEWVMGEWK